MECQRVRGEVKPFGDLTGSHALRPGSYQQAKDFQAIFLSERGESRNGVRRFHISANIEAIFESQEAARLPPFRLTVTSPCR